MKINQVEELVGITKKNIRFYESQGLVRPGRDPENGYREYTLADVEQLNRIKLLRQLGVSCEQIRELTAGTLSFDKCMRDHRRQLGTQAANLGHMQELCRMLEDEVDSLAGLNAEEYLGRMRSLEKGGVQFMNIKSSDVRKRTRGAVLAAAFIIFVMVALIVVVIFANRIDPAPRGVLWITIGLFGAIAAGVAAALVLRIRELKGGELDEADKY